MKALIIGASGQLGHGLTKTCPDGLELVALTRADLDLSDMPQIAQVLSSHKPDFIFNASAYTAVDKAESEPDLAYAINAHAVAELSKQALLIEAKLIHVSTDFVFNGAQPVPYAPEDAADPQGVYGASKRAGEEAVDPKHLIVRTAWVYSEHGHNFVKTMLRLMAEKEALSVVADQIGTPTYANSLAKGLWDLALKGASGILHYTDSGAASWYDFAVAIQEEALAIGLLNRAIPIAPIATADYPTPATRPSFSVLDKAKTWDILGDHAPHWRVNLRTMLRSLKSGG